MGEISNFQIENAIANIGDDDFVGVFPSNYMNKFINYAAMISAKERKYPFVIANTDDSSKGGTHWWSILDIEPKTDIFFFDSFGLDGLKHFMVQDDQKIVEKVPFGTEKMTRTDNKRTLCKMQFNLNACKNLSKVELDSLSDAATIFFHFIQSFSIKLKLRNFVNIWMVEDRVQDLDSSTCGIFQLYFYDSLFNPDENSKKQGNTKLNKKSVETLLNKLFTLDDQNKNEKKMLDYADSIGVKIT